MSEEQTIPQMRETIDRLSKDKTGLERTVQELRSEVRTYQAKEVAVEAGYMPAHGKLYAAVNTEGDVTVEALAAFAMEQGLPPAASSNQGSSEEEESSTETKESGDTNLAGMAGGGSRAGDGGDGGVQSETLTRQAWQELFRADPAAARQAVASGRVEIDKGNPHLRNRQTTGGNPFAEFVAKQA